MITTPTTTAAATFSNLTSVKQFIRKYPTFTQGGLRQLIFLTEDNGLAKAGGILRVGRKVLIHEEKFLEWIMLCNKRQ